MKAMTMGLDMFAYKTKETITASVDFDVKDFEEIHYWRKHPNLHGWMEDLYRKMNGAEDSFNAVNLELTGEDLDQLELDITRKMLPPTTGFFFGESNGSELDDDLAFIAKARSAIDAGYSVFYSSWW